VVYLHYGRGKMTVTERINRVGSFVVVGLAALLTVTALWIYYVTGRVPWSSLILLTVMAPLLLIARNRAGIEKRMPLSLPVRFVILAVLMVIYNGVIYYWLWGSVFYRMESVEGSPTVDLVYLVPERRVRIDMTDITWAAIGPSEFPHGHEKRQIKIKAGDGKIYHSRPFFSRYEEEIRNRLLLMRQ